MRSEVEVEGGVGRVVDRVFVVRVVEGVGERWV